MACKVGSFTKVLSLKVSFVDSLTLKMVPKNKQTDLGATHYQSSALCNSYYIFGFGVI